MFWHKEKGAQLRISDIISGVEIGTGQLYELSFSITTRRARGECERARGEARKVQETLTPINEMQELLQ